jgi:hypothetical protein
MEIEKRGIKGIQIARAAFGRSAQASDNWRPIRYVSFCKSEDRIMEERKVPSEAEILLSQQGPEPFWLHGRQAWVRWGDSNRLEEAVEKYRKRMYFPIWNRVMHTRWWKRESWYMRRADLHGYLMTVTVVHQKWLMHKIGHRFPDSRLLLCEYLNAAHMFSMMTI